MWHALHEIDKYLRSQSARLVNYAARYRAGMRIGTAVTEGTANFLVNRRMNKSQQMRWSRRGADLVLQVRCAFYNGTLGSGFGQRFEPIGRPDVAIAISAWSHRFLDTPAAVVPAIRTRRPLDHRSRAKQWCDAVSVLTTLQPQYAAWLEALPENLQDSALAEALQAICDFDLTEPQAIIPPRAASAGTDAEPTSRRNIVPVPRRQGSILRADRGSLLDAD